MAIIENAAKTPGWMSMPEIEWLAQQAQSHKRIAEIGSFMGRSTLALADNTSGWVLAVDDWKGPRDTTMTWKEKQVLYEKFSTNLRHHIDSGKVIPWKVGHEDVEKQRSFVDGFLNGQKFDMVFIDGDHKYASVIRDIKFWIELLEPGGLLCGHDYDLSYPGIVQSISETIGEPGIVPYTTIWWHTVGYQATEEPVATESVVA